MKLIALAAVVFGVALSGCQKDAAFCRRNPDDDYCKQNYRQPVAPQDAVGVNEPIPGVSSIVQMHPGQCVQVCSMKDGQ